MAQPSIDELLDSGLRHQQAGRLADAETIYRQILAREPNQHLALHLLGVIARRSGHLAAAADLFQRAIESGPGIAGYHVNLGNTLRDLGRLDEANKCYRDAISIDPNFALAYYNLGDTLIEMEDLGALDESIAASREAIRLKPDYAEAHSNLGIALRRKGNLDESIVQYRKALELKPAYAEVHNNQGNLYQDGGSLRDAVAAYRQAIAIRPDFALAHYNLGFALLLQGDMEAGWPEHEWRLKNEKKPRVFPKPQWTGEDLHGKTILLWGEQGIGDNIQFVRYAPLVAARGGRILLQCRPEINRLLKSSPALGEVVNSSGDLPPYDCHCALMSLPWLFKTDLKSIPVSIPYLHPEPALVESWKQRLGPPDGQLRIGLVWAGNPQFKDDRTRSMNIKQLAPLAAVHGVKFLSLQKGAAEAQAKNPPPGLELIDLGPELKDFADTAAAMSVLDLIITTDTSVPSLAGALGRPVWTMLQFSPDFRWLLGREDSPWYPTMRLFRQTSRGDWKGLVDRVAQALNIHVAGTPK